MELKLQQLVDRLMKVAALRNLSDENPIKITLENPNTPGSTIIVVSVFEPWTYPLPFNVVWLCADPNSVDYRCPLKRRGKSPSALSPTRKHSWDKVTLFADVFHPAQYYDPNDETPDDILHAQFTAHMYDKGNPHAVTAQQATALPLSGGRLSGPLFLARSPLDPDEASRKSYIDSLLSVIRGDVVSVNSGVINLQVSMDGLATNIDDVDLRLTHYQNRPNQTYGYRFIQSTPNSLWMIEHNLNSAFAVVSVFDVTGELVFPDSVLRSSSNLLAVSFLTPVAGSATVCAVA